MMLNTFMGHSMEESVTSNPRNQRSKPASVLLYNKTMGAVDESDKCVKPYESVRKSYKWYKKVYFHLLDLAMYNSYVLFKILRPNTKISYKEFIRLVVQEILTVFPPERKVRGRPNTGMCRPQ